MTPLLSVLGLSRVFSSPGGILRKKRQFRAVSDVSFDVARGEVLGVVGESGCGKSTLARLVLRLIAPSSGAVLFDGQDIASLPSRVIRPLRRHFQMVFQDPYSSIDPRLTVRDALLEPFRVQGIKLTNDEARTRIDELLTMVSLPLSMADSYQHQLSGGQKQRVGIARALALSPALIVLDEPTASLDVSIQAQVIALLQDLRDRLDLTYMFISHDLALVQYFCDRILVMYLGRIVEVLPRGALPVHPYTKALMDSAFVPDPHQRRDIPRISGEIPSGYDAPKGCAFAGRCLLAEARCSQTLPPLLTITDTHAVACHVLGPVPHRIPLESSNDV
ncbi:MAG: ABC transporter ATP-binding protein [Allorhizobium sp.]